MARPSIPPTMTHGTERRVSGVVVGLMVGWAVVGAADGWAARQPPDRDEFAVRVPWGLGASSADNAPASVDQLMAGMDRAAVRTALGEPVRVGFDPAQPGREYWEYLEGTTADPGDSVVLQFDFGQLRQWRRHVDAWTQ